MQHIYIDVPSPFGNFCMIIARDAKKRDMVIASGFGGSKELVVRARLTEMPKAYKGEHPHMLPMRRYFAGERCSLRGIKMIAKGSSFEKKVWSAIVKIPYGKTATYKSIAEAIGRPSATRAVGRACGKNMHVFLVPCHRVLRSDGGLGGYVYGQGIKKGLLALESK